jgi:RNA polymerase sigma factor (sigma-70 family)
MTAAEASAIVNSLFRDWYPFLVRFASRARGSGAAAEDAVQQALLELYTALLKGTEIRNPRAWTLKVIRRAMYRSYHAMGTRPECLEAVEGSLDALSAISAVDESLQWIDVRRMMAVLTAREEEVLLLRLQALKYREIAEILGITTQSVSTLLIRAVSKLRQATGSTGVEESKGALRWAG